MSLAWCRARLESQPWVAWTHRGLGRQDVAVFQSPKGTCTQTRWEKRHFHPEVWSETCFRDLLEEETQNPEMKTKEAVISQRGNRGTVTGPGGILGPAGAGLLTQEQPGSPAGTGEPLLQEARGRGALWWRRVGISAPGGRWAGVLGR